MPVAIEESADGNGLLYTSFGKVMARQLFDGIELMRSLAVRDQHWKFCLHDLTKAESVECASHEIRALALRAKDVLSPILPKGLAVAVVTSNDHHFALARMWQVYAEDTDWETCVFRSVADADRWIRDIVKAKFGIDVQTRRANAASSAEL